MKLLLFTLAFGATLIQFAQAQTAMSLKDCIDYGLKQNITLKRAQLDLKNNHARVLEGVSSYLPQIKGTGTLTDNLQLQQMAIPGELFGAPGTTVFKSFGKQYNTTGAIQATQTIYDQSYISSIAAARESNHIFETRILKSEDSLIYSISTIFYQAQITAEKKKLVEASFVLS
jgi:outer membrane protein TolC